MMANTPGRRRPRADAEGLLSMFRQSRKHPQNWFLAAKLVNPVEVEWQLTDSNR